ncbi:uncharacterized protein LOC129746597 isoform X1 [Uranotaenia lowii]|uniref:uncharacterized protein LOC129746597 isoform X1 n=2 Tax=Uranotaenia lowii TaxID=190385 RepID=UPI0024793AB9|nr:uncharacterized protein LOC129746597 isoform X1 [Uranotaenia lowii]
MSSMSQSNFKRSQSRVWYGNGPPQDNPAFSSSGLFGISGSGYYFQGTIRTPLGGRLNLPSSFPELDEEDELSLQRTPEKQANGNVSSSSSNNSSTRSATNLNWNGRQGSPASHKSQDSGFSDTELSPNMPSTSRNRNENLSTPDKLTPKRTINEQLFQQRSPSIGSEAPTPPTVIRRPAPQSEHSRPDAPIRRISYSSEPSSPAPSEEDLMAKIDSINFNNTSPLIDSSHTSAEKPAKSSEEDESPSSSTQCQCPTRSSGSSLKRGRVITKCVLRVKRDLSNQLRDSDEQMISLDSSELSNILNKTLSNEDNLAALKTPKSILKSSESYNNETVVFGYVSPEHATRKDQDPDNIPTRDKELPTYSELYPNGTSTPIMYPPKFYRSLPQTPTRTQRSPMKLRPTKLIDNFYEEPQHDVTNRISTGDDLNFTHYENPLLNGHTPAVQSWLDGLRFSYQSEVMSILQTKSISTEAGRNLKMTSATAVKLIRHLQTKVMTLQGEFERVEKIFSSIKRYQQQLEEDDDEDDDEKEIYQQVAPIVLNLANNIYDFVQKQKSNDYFGKEKADLKKFRENTQSLVDMTTDLRIASANGEDFDYRSVEEEIQIIKRYFLITTRLIFKNLVKVIVDAIEDSRCDLMLRSNLSYIANLSNLDYQGLASLNDAFISNGAVRALLIVCIESKFSSIRALALRALATVCSTTETIRQLEKADGIEVLRDILSDRRSASERAEPELREAVSVLTQITAPWHGEDHRIDGLKQHLHAIVEAVTALVDRTTCCQTLLLCSACLNNMTRLESTALYSLMSHETANKLRLAVERRGPGASIFLYEQITAMLFNMSSNKKCHHHLANSRPLIHFLTGTFNQKFYARPGEEQSRVEAEAQRKTIRHILQVLIRLLASGAISGHDELLESTIVPIFARVGRHPQLLDDRSEHFRDLSCLQRRLNESRGQAGSAPSSGSASAFQESDQIVTVVPTPAPVVRNPYVTRLTIEHRPNGGGIIMLDKNRQESYV